MKTLTELLILRFRACQRVCAEAAGNVGALASLELAAAIEGTAEADLVEEMALIRHQCRTPGALADETLRAWRRVVAS